MIREVFNAISGSAGKTPQQGMAGNETSNISQGFFGKMLMALQDQNGEPSNNGKSGSYTGMKGEAEQKQPSFQFGMMPAQVSAQQTELEGQPTVSHSQTTEITESPKLSIGVVKVAEGEAETQKIEGEEVAKTKATETQSENLSYNISNEVADSQSSQETEKFESVKTEGAEQKPETTILSGEEPLATDPETENSTLDKKEEGVQKTITIGSAEGESQETEKSATPISPTIGADKVAKGSISPEQEASPLTDAQRASAQQKTEHTIEVKSDVTQKTSGPVSQQGDLIPDQEASPEVEAKPKNADLKSEQKTDQPLQSASATTSQHEIPLQENGKDMQRQVIEKEAKATSTPVANQSRETTTERPQPLQSQTLQEDITVGESAKDSLKAQVKMSEQQSQEERQKRYDFTRATSDGNTISGERLSPLMGANASGHHQQNMSFSGQPNWLKFQVAAQQNSSITEDQQAFMNEQVTNASSETEMDEAEQMGINMNRLTDVPIANATLRRSILPGLTSSVQRAAAEGKENPQMWQKHSFEMEDGNRIELSTRNIDGVIQVKIASSSPELSKLMQQYGQEIREHLEKECEVNIDLQFNDGQENEMSGFFGDSDSRERGGNGPHPGSNTDRNIDQKSKEHIQQAVRKFGYNQMEWTA